MLKSSASCDHAMAFDVHWLKSALNDLYAITDWIFEADPDAATAWLTKIESRVATLHEHPLRCPLAPENALVDFEVRHLIIGKGVGAFRVLFEVDMETVYIHAVRRSSQDIAQNL